MKFSVPVLLLLVGCSSSPIAPPVGDAEDVQTMNDSGPDMMDAMTADVGSDPNVIDISIDAQPEDLPVNILCDSHVLKHDFDDLEFFQEHNPLVNVTRLGNEGAPIVEFLNSAAVFEGMQGLEARHEDVWENSAGSIVVQVTIDRRPNPTEIFTIISKDRLLPHQGDFELKYDENGTFTFRLQDGEGGAVDLDREVYVTPATSEPATFLVHLGWDAVSMRMDVNGMTDSRAIDNAGGLTGNRNRIAFGISTSRKTLAGGGDYAAELYGKIHYFSMYDRTLSDAAIANLPMCADPLQN